MGTRNLTCVVKNGKFKVAQYGQWDGDPSGNGITILEFLRSADPDKFCKQVDKCFFGSETEISEAYKAYSNEDGWMTMKQSGDFKKSAWAHLSRDVGADILEIIMNSPREAIMLQDSRDFAGDGLFCEWAYVVDLDYGVLEVYSGFHHGKVPEGQRFAYLQDSKTWHDNKEYSPVQLVAKFSLNNLPNNKDFVKNCSPEDEEDEI